MIWGDGLRTNPGALQAKAAEIISAHSGLQQSLTAHRSTELGPWRGEAARAERSQHRKIESSLSRQVDVLPKAASALRDAATEFSNLKSTQQTAVARAASWQYRYTEWGVVRSTVEGINLDPRRPFIRADLQRISLSLTVRLNAADVGLSVKLGGLFLYGSLDALGDDVVNGLIDGGEWAGDTVMNGLDWGRDRITEAAAWGQDRVQEVIGWFNQGMDAARPAWDRLRETLGTTPRWLTDLLEHGEVPQLAEVLGSATYIGGQLAGVGWNFLSGSDKHFFDDGRPWSGSVTTHPQTNYTNLADVMATAMDVYNTHDPLDPHDRASIQVTAVEGPDGQIRYIAAIPGSTEGMGAGGWFGRESGMDWAANLKGVGFGTTSATQAAMDAIDKAIQQDMATRGLTGTPQLLLTGHSQGGILAANMAADSGFTSRYDVAGIVSAGSPQQTIPVPADIPVYNFQNQYDPVPRVDFGGMNVLGETPVIGNQHQLVIPHEGSYLPTHTHEQQYYMDGIRDLVSGNGSPTNVALMNQLDGDLGNFFNGETTAYRVAYGREVDR